MSSGIKSFVIGFIFGGVVGMGLQHFGVPSSEASVKDVAPVQSSTEVM